MQLYISKEKDIYNDISCGKFEVYPWGGGLSQQPLILLLSHDCLPILRLWSQLFNHKRKVEVETQVHGHVMFCALVGAQVNQFWQSGNLKIKIFILF
jgi:hypothetical protein